MVGYHCASLAPDRSWPSTETGPLLGSGHVTRVLLIRHGQSVWNADGRWQGQENPPLTTLGRKQAQLASHALGAVDAIYSSPLARAFETASIISEHVGIGPVVTAPGLMERNAGEWQGLTHAQIEEAFPGYLEARKRPPSWEPDDQVDRRVFAALDEIANAHEDGLVLAVAHAGVIFAVETHFRTDWERLANLGGRWLERRSGSWQIGERVHLLIEETIPDQL